MATLRGQIRIEATVPDATAVDPAALALAIAATLASILGISGVNVAELRVYQLELGP